MIPDYNDIIQQGATFYRVVSLFSDAAKTIPLPLANKTPRSTLMLPGDGSHVADFACAVLGDPANGQIVWTMPRATTAMLRADRGYLHNIDLDDSDGITTDRSAEGQIIVHHGQKPA